MRFAIRAVRVLPLAALLLANLGTLPLRGAPDRACHIAAEPAATLLFPYFEVDLDDPGGRTTLIAIRSYGLGHLTHVVVWSDWGIPAAAFDLYLGEHEVRTLNLRDLLVTGRAPTTTPDLVLYPNCAANVGGPVIAPDLLQAALTGRPVLGRCFSSLRADSSVATGYITVDVVRRCSSGSTTPASPGYFTGGNRVATSINGIEGDFFLVDPGGNFAGGENAVHIRAFDGEFDNGDRTFYERFVGGSAADERQRLPSHWTARSLVGGAFDGGTDFIVWRDTEDPAPAPLDCGNEPSWYPPYSRAYGFPEIGDDPRDFGHDVFPLATQRVNARDVFDPPFDFGSYELYFGEGGASQTDQAWVIWLASAVSRFSVMQTGRMRSPCN